MIFLEGPSSKSTAVAEFEDIYAVDFEELIDEEEERIFAEEKEDGSNRCLAGFYGGTHSERGLRCVRPAGDHRHHLSEKDWWGVSQLWEDHQPEATAHYLERPKRRISKGRRKKSGFGTFLPARKPRPLGS